MFKNVFLNKEVPLENVLLPRNYQLVNNSKLAHIHVHMNDEAPINKDVINIVVGKQDDKWINANVYYIETITELPEILMWV